MQIISLTKHFAVSPQLLPSEMAAVAERGFKVLINNRPDGETGDQPDNASIERAALAVGLEYHYMPFNAASFPGPDPDLYARLTSDASRPVLAFCRTGTRCTNLWVVTRAESEREQAVAHARGLGFDLEMALTQD